MKKIIQDSLQKATSYSKYRTLVSDFIAQGKSTGEKQSEALLNYSILNDKRMKRLDKTIKLSEKTITKIKAIKTPQTWLILTESWCGDAAQTMPVINKMANESEHINFKVVLRDENSALMNQFLTNGNKSIPKLIIIDKNGELINSWGPRPTSATKMVENYINANGSLDAIFKKDLQIWYNKDKGITTQKDILSLLK